MKRFIQFITLVTCIITLSSCNSINTNASAVSSNTDRQENSLNEEALEHYEMMFKDSWLFSPDSEVKIDVSIIVKYGAKIPEVATRIQEKITADVESMTGFKVVSVNVKVQGVEDNTESEIEKSSEDIAKNETTEEE